jgi:AraC-like DNA-binding protein
MANSYHENMKKLSDSGIQISYLTIPGGYRPAHWHEELELLYQLNGETDINIEGEKHRLLKKHLMVVNSSKVHSTYCHDSTETFVCVHISQKHMQKYIPDIEFYQINCCPDQIPDESFPQYQEICNLMERLTHIYIEDVFALSMEEEGIILQILALLLRYFSTNVVPVEKHTDILIKERIHDVIIYVDEHYREQISSSDLADYVGLDQKYFCRFFKKHMGMSFHHYLSEIRLAHIYQEIISTNAPIKDIAERNGMINQKLFNQKFKELYGCNPSAVRKGCSDNQASIVKKRCENDINRLNIFD